VTTKTKLKPKPRIAEMVLLCRNNAVINVHVKVKTGSNTGSDTLTHDLTRHGQNRWPSDQVPSLLCPNCDGYL